MHGMHWLCGIASPCSQRASHRVERAVAFRTGETDQNITEKQKAADTNNRQTLALNGRISWFPRARANSAPGKGAVPR